MIRWPNPVRQHAVLTSSPGSTCTSVTRRLRYMRDLSRGRLRRYTVSARERAAGPDSRRPGCTRG